jgi:hypothetical protein
MAADTIRGMVADTTGDTVEDMVAAITADFTAAYMSTLGHLAEHGATTWSIRQSPAMPPTLMT